MEQEDKQAKALELMKDFRTAMLITHGDGSDLHARPMVVAELSDSGQVTFLTDIGSTKAREIRADSTVLLTFQSERSFMSATGRATVRRDPEAARRHWSVMDAAWFDGPDDPSLGVVTVQLETAEYWDNRGRNMLSFIGSLVRGAVHGERPQHGDNQHGVVNLS